MSTVLARINLAAAILQENPWIKDMSNSQFKSVDIDQIRRHVGAAETEAGLVVQYRETYFGHEVINGKTIFKVAAVLTYYSIDDEEMEHGLDFPRSAIGYDTLDKGYNKAESMLYKNHYKGLYHIGERADDPDEMSNEEHELLETFRFCAQTRDKNPYYEQICTIMREAKPLKEEHDRLEEEARKKAKKERLAKQAAGDSFFSKPAQIIQPAMSEQEVRQKALAIRPVLKKTMQEHMGEDIVDEYLKKHGPVDTWPDTIVVRAWKDDFMKMGGSQ